MYYYEQSKCYYCRIHILGIFGGVLGVGVDTTANLGGEPRCLASSPTYHGGTAPIVRPNPE